MSDYITLWDGTRTAPMGPYFAVKYDVPIHAAESPHGIGMRAKVANQLRRGPNTIRGVADLLQVDSGAIGGAFGSLVRAGSIAIVGVEWSEHCHRDVWVYGMTDIGRKREAMA